MKIPRTRIDAGRTIAACTSGGAASVFARGSVLTASPQRPRPGASGGVDPSGVGLAIDEPSSRRTRGAAWVACFAAALGLTGCARCSGESSGASGVSGGGGAPPSGSSALPAKAPAPSPWTLSTVRMPTGVAVPERCHQRAPLLVATVPITSHFAADPRTLGLLVVADTEPSPPAVLRSGELIFPGARAVTGGAPLPGSPAVPGGAPLPGSPTVTGGAWVPWPDARSAPRLARIGGQWIGAWDVARKNASSEVRLYRGGTVTSLGEGDLYTSADLACGPSRCVLLTSRLGRVAPAGADVVLLAADPSVPPRTITFEPEGDSAARPFGLAAVEGPHGTVAVLLDRGEAVFWSPEAPSGDPSSGTVTLSPGAPGTVTPLPAGPGVLARLPAEHGVLEALLLGERPLVLAHGNVVDEKGCAREGSDIHGAKLRIVLGGEAPIDIATPGAPSLAALRPLAVGALALWISPLGCGAERRVLYGLVLDATGAPVGEPLPIADAETFAAASSGSDADVWLRNGDKVFWLRMSCAP